MLRLKEHYGKSDQRRTTFTTTTSSSIDVVAFVTIVPIYFTNANILINHFDGCVSEMV